MTFFEKSDKNNLMRFHNAEYRSVVRGEVSYSKEYAEGADAEEAALLFLLQVVESHDSAPLRCG